MSSQKKTASKIKLSSKDLKAKILESKKPQDADDVIEVKENTVKKKFNFWERKNAAPPALGSKEIPEGREGCLTGMTFVITGQLSSITREGAADLIMRCGGRVTSAVSSKTTYLIVGEDPGETKVSKANSLSTPTLDEDAFFALVRFQEKAPPKEEAQNEKPTKKPFWAVKHAAPPALGSKDIPVGVEDSLSGKTFVLTGQLSSITRDDTMDLIKRCGGRVTSAVSSKTTYLIVGEDPGETKVAKANSLNTPTLDEDKFFELVRSFEGQPKPASETKKDNKINFPPAASRLPSQVKRDAATKASFDRPTEIKQASELWVDKYRPTSLREMCGNNAAIEQLSSFLMRWDPKALDGNSTRAVLISGPPGIGKTTAAHLACQAAGFSPIEFNASDTRSKISIEDLLSEFVDNRSITEFFKPTNRPEAKLEAQRPALILDEIDGMSGGDRGGVAEIIKYIKRTKVPIICICNDRMSPKVRSLAAYCIDLKFRRIEMIAKREGLMLSSNVIDKLFEMSHSDIRQVINLLSTWRLATQLQKNILLDPFKIVEKYLNAAAYGNHTLADRIEFYFHDFQIAPLMVQENYVRCRPRKLGGLADPAQAALRHLELLSEAADCISQADLIDRSIQSSQNWGLMPIHAAYSCAMPSELMHGHMLGMYNFPAWLGQNSKANKYSRQLKVAHLHVKSRVSGNKNELRQAYLPTLVGRLTLPLLRDGLAGVPKVLGVMDHYFLERDDWDALIDLRITQGPDPLLASLPTAVKSAFTRSYNKAPHPTIVHAKLQPGRTKGKLISNAAAAVEMDEVLAAEDDTVEPEEEEEAESDNATQDKLVAKRSAPAKRKASAAPTRGAKKSRGR
ncbi:DNA replication factor C complex subunit Rfc1 [Massospora cicadina]|nr:DNA replication factor C complex subunit Rfc1 [Massospora cicadina]